MYIAIIYEDQKIFVKYTPEEFVDSLEKYIGQGKTPREAVQQIIKDLKAKTRYA